jgi:hypothetical protein
VGVRVVVVAAPAKKGDSSCHTDPFFLLWR